MQFLRGTARPSPTDSARTIRIVDLFAGCGGMSLGMEEAARRLRHGVEIPLAIDSDPTVLSIYKRNFPFAGAVAADVGGMFDGRVGGSLTFLESRLAKRIRDVDVILGGPPCQGHSDLNNHTRRRDPRNALYLSIARAAEVLEPKVVVIENVVSVQHDQTGIVLKTSEALTKAGYQVAGQVIDLLRLGVPQRRRRFILIGSKIPGVIPSDVLASLEPMGTNHPHRTVRWAIEDLVDVRSDSVFDTASAMSQQNAKRIVFLFKKRRYDLPNSRRPKCHRDGNHSYVSMYGRLRWDRPAQTITTGFGSMGQGRYVHPRRRRTLTPHEAARLQTFPDWFDFGLDASRGILAKAIGNAVPPLLMLALGDRMIPLLFEDRRLPKAANA